MIAEREKKQPGVMIYFDLIPIFETMPKEELGGLFLDILRYAQDHRDPALIGTTAPVVWPLIKNRIEDDSERYAEKCRNRRNGRIYNSYVKTEINEGRKPLERDEWEEYMQNFGI